MPTLKRAPNERELQAMVRLFLKAETDIINEISRLRAAGNVDYHAEAALERVQSILRNLESDAWTYAPALVEKQFYVRVPEARRIAGETQRRHLAGYANAHALTGEQTAIVDRLVQNLMGEVTAASVTVMESLQSALVGRPQQDLFRRIGLEQAALQKAVGAGTYKMLPGFVEQLRREGVTAFVDKAGRKWSLHTYGAMVSRTTSRQAEVLAVLTADPEQDLYKISSHGTSCPLCAPYEGRVYSRSGSSTEFPALADAFGKVDPAGPNSLANSWLNIHPNCLHVLMPWTPAGRSREEIDRIRDFSNPRKNPYSVDSRSEKQIQAYRNKERARRHYLDDYRQWERYRLTIPDQTPKTFQTFQRHKAAGDSVYEKMAYLYRNRDNLLTNAAGKPVVKVDKTLPSGFSNSITQINGKSGGVSRNYYDKDGVWRKQISNNNHGNQNKHPYGKNGEHTHDIIWENGKIVGRPARELTDGERQENGDIL